MGWDLAVIATVLLAYAVVSKRLGGSIVTPAIVFVVGGFVLGSEVLGVFKSEIDSGTVRLLAEVTLALVLFTDASGINSRLLSRETAIPTRLLLVGLPLTIVAGTVAALLLFPQLIFFEAVVLAVLLAPTDAALGQAVVSDERLPSRLRQGLNVESGLNDGICVPLLFGAIAFAELEEMAQLNGQVLVDLVKEIGVAAGVGGAVATIVCAVFNASRRRRWLDAEWAQIVPIGAATIAYTATTELGGSGFIAAFVAGLLYGRFVGHESAHQTTRLMEEVGGLLSGVTFFVFGAVVIGVWVTDLDGTTVIFALLSLTLIRMVPLGLSFIGSGARLPTVAFAGWFGPRGLATIVFALILVEDANLPHTPLILQVAAVTVVLSVLAHGVSAPVLTNRYVRWRERTDARAPEPTLSA